VTTASPSGTPSQPPTAASWAYPAAVYTAVVAGIFCAVVAGMLLVDYARRGAVDPHENAAYIAAKEKLAELSAKPQTPEVEARGADLRVWIRAMDLQLRHEYFAHRKFSRIGALLLLGGAVGLLVAWRAAVALRPRAPDPGPHAPPQDLETVWTRWARAGVGAVGLLLVATAVALLASTRGEIPSSEAELAALLTEKNAEGGATAPAADFPTPDELARNWPRFRGPEGSGISPYTDVPASWNEASGQNVVWKTPVPLPGNSSPVVWADRLFLSGADKETCQVYCFNTADGKLLWTADVPGSPQSTTEPPEVMRDTGYAAPTGVTDGRRFYTMFANGDVAAFDFEGELVWQERLGMPENAYGHAASLAMYRNLVLVQFDQGGRKDNKSRLIALEGATGKTAWKAPRPVPNSWASPIVVHANGGAKRDQLITAGDPFVISYNPADGAEWWRAKCLQADVGPSPVFRDGVVYVANEFPQLTAIKADGTSDVTESHILWTGEDGLPDACSPLASEKYLFLLASYGILTCYDRESGEWLWELELDGHFYSSPSLVGDRVYLFAEVEKPEEEMTAEDEESEDPVMICRAWIVEPGAEEGKIVAENRLEEGCVTSPAFQPGRFFIRGRKHLYCIGQP
jgi:outer membrane protein assembly factor BamB